MAKFILSGFADEIADSLDIQIEVLQRLGLRHMEMRGVNGKNVTDHSLAEIAQVKAKLDAGGIRVSAVGSPIGKVGIHDDLDAHFEKFRHTVALAKALDTQYIRMFSFFMPEGEDPDRYTDAVLTQWTRFADYARQQGIVLLHENEKGIYGDVPARCRTLLDSQDFAVVRGIFDPANFIQCGVRDIPAAFDLLRDKIVYLHIKDARAADGVVVPSGEGDGKIRELIARLAAENYEGFLSIEPHLHTGDISVGGPELFERAWRALRDILAEFDAEVA